MKISVAICTYNGEQYIESQLNSILHQSRVPDEIILGDDGSADLTVQKACAILREGNIPFKIIENKNSLGPFANFQNVIMQCSGDIIFTSDQDDVWLEDKIKIIEKYFIDHANMVLVFSNGYITDSALKIKGKLWNYISFSLKKQTKMKKGLYYDVLLGRNYVTGAASAYKRSFVQKAFPITISKKEYLHDYWLALIAPLFGEIGLVEQPLFYYRQHGNNVIGVKSKKLKAKIGRWFANAKTNLANSEKFYNMSHDICIQVKNLNNNDCKSRLENWEKFCSWRNYLCEMTKAKATFSILNYMIHRKYKKYYAYAFCGLQDLIARFAMKK